MGLLHHGDRGGGWQSVDTTARLTEAAIEPAAGSVGASDDKASAEAIRGLCKAEVSHRRDPWRSVEAVACPTSDRVDWFADRCRLGPSGNSPPAVAEADFWAALATEPMAA